MKKVNKIVMFLILLTLCSFTVVKADYTECSNCHIYGGKWSFTPAIISYWKDSSVSMYGYGDSIANAVSGWSSVPSPAPTLNLASSESAAHLKYYISENVLDPDIGGLTEFYALYSGTWTDISDSVPGTDIKYGLAKVVVDHANIKDLSIFGPDFRTFLVGHETGHALGLNHFEYWPAHTGDHWMKTCLCTLTAPTTTNKNHMQQKYIQDY